MTSLESIRQLRLPEEVENRLRALAQRDGAGVLTDSERRELSLLIEVSESISSLRKKAEKLANTLAPASRLMSFGIRNGLPVVLVPASTPPIDPAAVRRCLQEEGF